MGDDQLPVKTHVVCSDVRVNWETSRVGVLWRWQERMMTYLAHLAWHQADTPAFAATVQRWKTDKVIQNAHQIDDVVSVYKTGDDPKVGQLDPRIAE